MRAWLPTAEVQFTQGPKDAIQLASAAAERGQQRIIAVGGDGTLHEVVQGLMQVSPELRQTTALGIWPAGSGADFARGLGMPQEIAALGPLFRDGVPAPVDLGQVHCVNAAGKEICRFFINAADFGIGAKIVENRNRGRKWFPGSPTYLWQTVRTLLSFRNPTVRLSMDDGPVEQRRIKSVVVANGSYFGGGMCIAPDAQPHDGQLDWVRLGDLGRFEAMRRLGETYSGQRITHPDIAYGRCRQLIASSAENVSIEADGELVGFLPATFQILPQALQLLWPNAHHQPG